MDIDWTTVSEELVLVHPSAPKYQTAISDRQADAVRQMADSGAIMMRIDGDDTGTMQINSRVVELRSDPVEKTAKLRVMAKASEHGQAVKPLSGLVELGLVQNVLRYEYEHLRPRSFGPLKGLEEEEADQFANNGYSEDENAPGKKLVKRKSTSKAIKRSKDASKSIAEFTARCIKDLRKKLIRENALRKTSRARRVMLTKSKRARVVRIAVEKVNTGG